MFGMNPWLLLAGLVAALSIVTGVYLKGREDGKAVIIASQAKALAAQQAMVAAELRSIGTNLSKLKVEHKTIHARVERETRIVTDYSRCNHTDSVFNDINQALTGEPVSGGELPKTDPAG